MKLSRERLQHYRSQYFGQNRENVQTDAIFPSLPTGPRFIRDKKDVCSKWTDLKQRCEDALKKPKKEDIVVTINSIRSQIEDDYMSFGVALHLLPIYPFGFLNTVLSSEKSSPRPSLSPNMVASLIVEDLRKHFSMLSSQWVNIYPESSYVVVLEHEASRRGTRTLPDPMSFRSSYNDDEWCRSLVLQNDGDRPFQTDRVMGQYLCDKASFCQAMKSMLDNLRRFYPHCISDPNKPLEFNGMMRLKMAAKCFGYDYRIEKIRSKGILSFGENNTIFEPGRHQGFIRIPHRFSDDVDSFLRQKHGIASVTTVVQHLLSRFPANEGVTSKSILWLIRELTHFENDDDDDVRNMQVTAEHHWIFFCNAKERRRDDGCGDHALPSSELVFKACNLKRRLCRSFSHCERRNGALQMDSTRYSKSFLKDTVIGFPYQCDLRDRDDVLRVCNHRFLTEREKLLHIQKHHGISKEEEKIMNTIQSNDRVLNNLKMTSQAQWLEERGLLGKMEEKDLIGVENLGDLFSEFVELHSVLMEALSQIRQSFQCYQRTMTRVKEEQLNVVAKSTEVATRAKIHGEVKAIERAEELFEKFVRIQESMLLPKEELLKYVSVWMNVINRQCSVLQKFNRATDKIQSAKMRGSRLANMLIHDWKTEVGQAGVNVGTLNPETLAQNLNSPCQVRDERDYSVLYLAIASQLARHEQSVSQNVIRSYLNQMNGGDANDRSDDDKETKQRVSVEQEVEDMEQGEGDDDESRRKRRFSDASDFDDSDKEESVALHKMMKKEEAMEEGELMNGSRFQEMCKAFRQKRDVIHIDSRHLDLDSMTRFVGGRKMLPGSEIVRVGKGSCYDDGLTKYDIVDPTTIRVDLNDYRDLMFYLLCVMRDRPHMDHLALYVDRVKCDIISLLNVMFALSMQGQEMVQVALTTAIESKAVLSMGFRQTVEQLWMFFLAAVSFLNNNTSGELNRWFTVRFCRHGDASMIPVKMLPDTSVSYHLPFEQEGGAKQMRYQMEQKKEFLFAFMCICTRDMLSTGGSCLVKVDHTRFFGTQAGLIEAIRDRYKQDIVLFQDKKQAFPAQNKKSKQSVATKDSSGSAPIMTTIKTLLENKDVKKPKKREKEKCESSGGGVPSQNEIEMYDDEINTFRMQLCCICREPFSNRPLEGLNCVYKEAERRFRKSRGLDDTIVLDENPNLLNDFWKVVSQKMEKGDHWKHDRDVDANGMHLFHRECLRRYIHLTALDVLKPTIECPICKTEVYSHAEKKVIRGNINEIACRLALAADSANISLHTTDMLINLKRSSTTFGDDPYVRYFPASFLENKGMVREDAALIDDMEVETSRHASKMEIQHGESKRVQVVQDYIDITLKKTPSQFSLKNAADLIHVVK